MSRKKQTGSISPETQSNEASSNRSKSFGKPGGSNRQPRKDSSSRRVNFDNERVSRLYADMKRVIETSPRYTNEMRWYNNNPTLIQAAGRLSFSSVTGLPISYDSTSEDAAPGVMTLIWSPRLGGRVGHNIINQVSADYYSFVVHANSRTKLYDEADLMMMTLAVAEIFSAIALGEKVYGLMRRFNEENLYSPAALINETGFNYPDLLKSYSSMWFDLNARIARVNSLWIPNDLPLIERRIWLNSNVFFDSTSIRGQMYQFKPYNFYKYEGFADKRGGQLVPQTNVTINNKSGFVSLTWQDYLSIIDTMINAVLNDRDRGDMMGDLLKAYGSERLYKMMELPIDYKTPVVYDPVVLSQIENATVIPSVVDKIAQDDNKIFEVSTTIGMSSTAATTAQLKYYGLPNKVLLNAHYNEQPSVEMITEMTRLTAVGAAATNFTGVNPGITPWACGTESICSIRIAWNSYSLTSSSLTKTMVAVLLPSILPSWSNYTIASSTIDADAQYYDTNYSVFKSVSGILRVLKAYAAFDWAPTIYYVRGGTAYNTSDMPWNLEAEPCFCEYNNYTLSSVEDIARIHTACLFSEWGFGHRI